MSRANAVASRATKPTATRMFLHTMRLLALLVALATFVGCASHRAAPARSGVVNGEVAAGVSLLSGVFTPGRQPDGNSVIIDAPEGLVVIDTGRHGEHTQRITDIAATRKKAIVAVINTHWHLDHVGGNSRIRAFAPNVRIFASDALTGAMQGFLADYRRQLTQRIATTQDDAAKRQFEKELAIIDDGDALRPDEVVTASGSRRFAGRTLQLHLARNAVTGGDIWLIDRTTRVAILGDLVTLPVPFLDTACPSKWRSVLERVAREQFDVAIPGHGPSLSRTEFEQYRMAFGALLDCAASAKTTDECADAWIAGTRAIGTPHDEKFTRTLLDYYIGQVLRGEPEKTESLCE